MSVRNWSLARTEVGSRRLTTDAETDPAALLRHHALVGRLYGDSEPVIEQFCGRGANRLPPVAPRQWEMSEPRHSVVNIYTVYVTLTDNDCSR